MSEPITITATVAAWLTSTYKPHDLLAAVRAGKDERVVNMLTFYGSPALEKFGSFIKVGEADVTVRLMPEDEQVSLAVKALRDQLEADRLKWLERQQQILEAINNLQALTYEPEVA